MAVVELIAATTTKAGLKVESALDTATYEKGIKVSNAQMKTLDIQGDAFHPEWNYTIRPRPTRLEKAAKRGEPCLRLKLPRSQPASIVCLRQLTSGGWWCCCRSAGSSRSTTCSSPRM
jgi:hypothetical protein